MLTFLIYPLLVFGLQGNFSAQVQFTEWGRTFQPATVQSLQANEESSDNLQPAMGYNTLNQPFYGELEVK